MFVCCKLVKAPDSYQTDPLLSTINDREALEISISIFLLNFS